MKTVARIMISSMLFAGVSAWAQGEQMTEEQKCQFSCAREIMECKRPCAPHTRDDLNDPRKKDAFMVCSKDCTKKSQPCLDKCSSKKEKKK